MCLTRNTSDIRSNAHTQRPVHMLRVYKIVDHGNFIFNRKMLLLTSLLEPNHQGAYTSSTNVHTFYADGSLLGRNMSGFNLFNLL